jgi:hypothetical protein
MSPQVCHGQSDPEMIEKEDCLIIWQLPSALFTLALGHNKKWTSPITTQSSPCLCTIYALLRGAMRHMHFSLTSSEADSKASHVHSSSPYDDTTVISVHWQYSSQFSELEFESDVFQTSAVFSDMLNGHGNSLKQILMFFSMCNQRFGM